jgi:hypothetical protein
MPTSFTLPEETTIQEMAGIAEDTSVNSGPGDNSSESGTEASASDYERILQEAPVKMFFGPKECRRTFEQSSDNNACVHICGNKDSVED